MPDATQVQADLEQASRALREHDALSTRLEAARGYLAATEERVTELRARLRSESEDVEKLESFSPTRIWAALKGSQASDLDRETAERDAARYAVAEAEARRDAAGRECDSLAAQLDALGDVRERHAQALAAKEQWAGSHDPVLADALSRIAGRRGELEARDQEAREAHEAGRAAAELLEHARALLGSAQSWSTWDTFGGGGMLTDMAKYNKMDQATAVLHQADVALSRFSVELADVGMAAVDGVRVDGMTRTFDMFFDNIFTDMAVRSRIQEAGRAADRAVHAVHQTLGRLQETGRQIQQELRELDAERARLLTG